MAQSVGTALPKIADNCHPWQFCFGSNSGSVLCPCLVQKQPLPLTKVKAGREPLRISDLAWFLIALVACRQANAFFAG